MDAPPGPQSNTPSLPLPEPIRSEEEGSFAHYTVTVRLPGLARLVMEENKFPPEIVARLEELIAEIHHGLVRPLEDRSAPDAANWVRHTAPYLGQTWLQVPWFFAEAYFFRRILEATGYFREGAWQSRDPYLYEKQKGLETNHAAITALAERAGEWGDKAWDRQAFASLLQADLWGNQADLSMWPVNAADRPNHANADLAQAHLLVDDTPAVIAGMERLAKVDFLVDNAGLELVGDLVLADYLLRVRAAAEISLHLKGHPTYISDATLPNVHHTIAFLADDPTPATRSLAARLNHFMAEERLRLRPSYFWCSPLAAWEMPGELAREIAGAGLFVTKGDANYRRLVGDRRWPYTTSFERVVSYFPAPLLALRIFKSEVAVGLRPGQAEVVAQKDPGWMTNGRWGIIQLRR